MNNNNTVSDVCKRTVRYCRNNTTLVKHWRFNHNTEYDEVMQRQSEEEERDRHYPGTERESGALATFITDCDFIKLLYKVSISYWCW